MGSAKSQKSVVWSTGDVSEIRSDAGLVNDETEKKEKKGNCCFRAISGTVITYLRNSIDFRGFVILDEIVLYWSMIGTNIMMTF